MARDRQRAKQRRRQREQRGGGSPPARDGDPTPDASAPPDVESAPAAAPDEIAKPDPMEHSSAEVEIAEAAMADPPVGDLSEEEHPAPDELDDSDPNASAERAFGDEEGGDEAAPARRRVGRGTEPGAELPREGSRLGNFLRASVAELRRVQWPDRRQVTQATGVVLGFVVIAGTYLGVLDAIFSRLVNAIL